MARKARERAESGVYYLRIDSSDKLLFIDDADRQTFLSQFEKAASDDLAEPYAYCLMSERVDLVVKEGLAGISPMIRSMLSSYTLYYNRRYDRKGRLFYDRFKSLPLEQVDDILDAVRYVVRLPLSFGQPLKYPWTSYTESCREQMAAELIMLAGGLTAWKEFMAEPSSFAAFDRPILTDEKLTAEARAIVEGYTRARLEAEYDDVLKKLLNIEGATVGQICRVLGVSRRRLTRVAKEKE